MEAQKQPKRWGDTEEEEDFGDGPDENGVRTVIERGVDEHGREIRIIKKIRTVRRQRKININVEARRRWRKFGDSAGLPPGPNPGVTAIGDEVHWDVKGKPQAEKEKDKERDAGLSGIVCKYCNAVGAHFSHKCPFMDQIKASEIAAGGFPSAVGKRGPLGPASPASQPAAGGKDVYVLPSQRRGMAGGAGSSMESDREYLSMRRREEGAKIRVTNLSEDTRESDLEDLFSPFGSISRIYLAKDAHNQKSKGFAFINFHRREDAAKAIEKLNGHGYAHFDSPS